MNYMCDNDILPLSIHDSFLFPANNLEYYSHICKSIFYKIIYLYKFSISKTKPTFNFLSNSFSFNYSFKNNILYFNNTKMKNIENIGFT